MSIVILWSTINKGKEKRRGKTQGENEKKKRKQNKKGLVTKEE
jgi:hypothetical protein